MFLEDHENKHTVTRPPLKSETEGSPYEKIPHVNCNFYVNLRPGIAILCRILYFRVRTISITDVHESVLGEVMHKCPVNFQIFYIFLKYLCSIHVVPTTAYSEENTKCKG